MAVCNLPVEIVAKILLYLDVKSKGRAAQVCSSWREASFYRPAWCGVRATIKIDDAAEIVCTSLGRRDIRDVRVTCIQKSLVHNLQLVPHLEKLDLSRCSNLSDANLMRTFKTKFSHMTNLNLSMCKNVDTEGIRAAIYALEKLQVLNLSGCVKILDDVLFEIALVLPYLFDLNISHTSVTDKGLRYFSCYHKRHRLLDRLIMENCQRITNDGLESISKSLPHLMVLDLSRCNGVTDFGMSHVAKIDSLKELNLEYCSWLTDNGITLLCSNLQLTSLKIGPCEVTNAGMTSLAAFMRSLEQLVLKSCRVDDLGVKLLCHSLNLKKLIIFKCDITDGSLLKIHDYCVNRGPLSRLVYIDIRGCSQVTSAGVWKLLKVPGMVLKKPGLIIRPINKLLK